MEAMNSALQLTMTGMTVVFFGLVLLSLLMVFFQYVDRWLNERQEQRSNRLASHAKPKESQHQEHEALSPELVAIIAAAATEAFGKQVRVSRIRYRSGPSESTWSRQGRITIMGSHHTKR